MADTTTKPTTAKEEELENEASPEEPEAESSSSSDEKEEEESDSDSDYDYVSDSSSESESDTEKQKEPGAEPEDEGEYYFQAFEDDDSIPNTEEENVTRFRKILNSKQMKKYEKQEEREIEDHEELFDFPKDPENWTEEDLQELWADAPLGMTKPGWDPAWVDEDEVEVLNQEIKEGRDPPIAPFYVPYRKPYPAIPDNHYDISNPKSVIEELDRIEEFLTWVSYIFEDGSSYEGTVWDDQAHGKGVYVAELGLVRYEGEWLQNNMEGHGVSEVDIPDIEPVPGSKLEEKMRAEGKIIKRDFMSPEDREWLEMDIEDSIRLAGNTYEVPFYENEEWIRQFGALPEKGRYRYAGQWKHGRMHGCGLFEVNERLKYGRFYFGNLLEDSTGCDIDACAVHAGIAEVAAAKARMFVNKPDGMVREERGPYGDPQHPYFYEEDDVWMAPGFINQFYEVPDYWKTYVNEVDQEREMWLNSFIKAPLRLPMPAELEHWWSKDESPEFVLINKEPEPDPEDPTKLVYTEDPLILHTPSGRIINYVEDEEHGVRMFWQPPLKEGEDVDPEKVEFLPLGFDEFYGTQEVVQEPNTLQRVLIGVQNVFKPMLENLEKWTEEQKKEGELKLTLIEKELDLINAEMDLEEAIEDMDEELKKIEEGADTNLDEVLQEEEGVVSPETDKTSQVEEEDEEEEEEDGDDVDFVSPEIAVQDDKTSPVEEEDEEDEEEDDDEDDEPPSFGTVIADSDSTKDGQNGKKPGKSPFSSLSLASCSILSPPRLASMGPPQIQWPFSARKEGKLRLKTSPSPSTPSLPETCACLVSFPSTSNRWQKLRAVRQSSYQKVRKPAVLRLGDPFSRKGGGKSERHQDLGGAYKSQEGVCVEEDLQKNILSWHMSLDMVSW